MTFDERQGVGRRHAFGFLRRSCCHNTSPWPEAVRYLNRLSDLLFVLSRVLARASGHGEVLWQHERRKKPKP